MGKAPRTAAVSGACRGQALHGRKMCRRWARWKRCRPTTSRTATARCSARDDDGTALGEGWRQRGARQGTAARRGSRRRGSQRGRRRRGSQCERWRFFLSTEALGINRTSVGYHGPWQCAAHVTLAELSSNRQLTAQARLRSAVVWCEVRRSRSLVPPVLLLSFSWTM